MFTSLDYKILPVQGVSNIAELNAIRNKNNSHWQSSTPKPEIKIEIFFKPSQLYKVEIKNNGSPQIEINCFEKNERSERVNFFTCLPKTKMFDALNSKLPLSFENEKSFILQENPLKPKIKYNALEIILSNPDHLRNPLKLGLFYLILFVKKDEEILKTPTKIGGFFDNESLSKQEKSPFSKENPFSFTGFKKERYGNLINQAPPKKELNALSLLKSNRENKTDELLGRKMEEKKDNHEFKTNYQNKSVQENNYDKQFEEELQRALAESIQTFQEKNEKLKRDLDDENNFNDYSQEDNLPDNGNFYEEYKKMIYPNESKRKFHEVYNENSMFPLIESDLSQRYFYLEKINK